MRRASLALILAASGVVFAAGKTEIEGTWKYTGLDAVFSVHLERGGDCSVIGSSSTWVSGYLAECTYELHWPYVDLHWKLAKDGARPGPLHLVLVGGGELMRVEGEARRPLRRSWDEPLPLPDPIDLGKPGAMAALEARDSEGYRRVLQVIELVQKHGCRGAWLGEINTLVRLDFIGCGSREGAPKITPMAFWLGDMRYFIDIPPR